MEVKTFLICFEKSLIADGFAPESARHHTLKIAKSLKDSDKLKIKSMRETNTVKYLADKYAERIKRLSELSVFDEDKADTVTIARHFSESTNLSDEEFKQYSINNTAKQHNSTDYADKADTTTGITTDNHKDTDVDNEDIDVRSSRRRSRSKDPDEERETTQKLESVKNKFAKVELTEEGKVNYRNFLLSKGIGIWALTGLCGAGSILVYFLISMLIVSLVALLVALSVIGCVGTLAGLIYGIVKLFSVLPEGLYEIGLAFVILGITIAAGIGIYNLAIRIIPMLWKLFTKFLRQKITDLRVYLNNVRTECNGK